MQKFYDILIMELCDTRRLRLLRHNFKIFFARVAPAMARARE